MEREREEKENIKELVTEKTAGTQHTVHSSSFASILIPTLFLAVFYFLRLSACFDSALLSPDTHRLHPILSNPQSKYTTVREVAMTGYLLSSTRMPLFAGRVRVGVVVTDFFLLFASEA